MAHSADVVASLSTYRAADIGTEKALDLFRSESGRFAMEHAADVVAALSTYRAAGIGTEKALSLFRS
jgi:hypothetical protein